MSRRPADIVACVLMLLLAAAEGAEFIFVNQDGAGEGLNDPTPAAPVGGNTATTLGAQRLAALERVGEIWGRYLVSSVPIRVEVEFDPLGGNTLAAAGPVTVESNFTNAPQSGMLYTVAQANSLSGTDLRPGINDISVTVNSDQEYYLGFNQDAATDTNFIDTLLHELGHGLGFISFVDESTGSYNSNTPDVFSSLIYDVAMGKRWTELTAAQRVTSATSGTNLAWDGGFSNAGANQVLGLASLENRMVLDAVLPDLTRLEDREYNTVGFAVRFPAKGVSGLLVVTDDGSGATSTLACQDIVNGAEVAGNIAFVRRGTCNFDDKVFRAQEAGAVAVVIADNVAGSPVLAGGDGIVEGEVVDITVPVVTISMADGDTLEAASPGVRLDFEQRPGTRFGITDGRLNLYAPSPVELGSSVSHWTTAASPNLLMEPVINVNLDRKLDLTLTQMKDIGWEVVDIPFPHDSYETWAARVFDVSETLTAEGDDADDDGATNIEEYFFGSLPDDGGSRRFPEFVLDGGVPTLELVVSSLPADLVYAIEFSDTLDGFDEAVRNVDVRLESRESIDDETERLVFSLVEVPEKRFARVRIETKGL
ncbi:MAG: PA domain-containing protein [Luteolibacter sp.]